MDENYFVSISDPVFLEKTLLSNAKSSLEFSIINQNIVTIKSQKAELFSSLKDDMDEIVSLLAQLNDCLPHKDLLAPAKPKPSSKKAASTSKKKSSVSDVAPSLSKLDKLNSSLAEIERKLNSLS